MNKLITYRKVYHQNSKMTKNLGIFDFDHTVVDDNTDVVVRKLLKNDEIPESIKMLYRSSGWTTYMQEIFKLLHQHRISEQYIRNVVTHIPAVKLVPEVIKTMVNELNFDVIIISDSNSLFIKDWLVAHNLITYVHSVFTNPAKYNDKGLLEIEKYHVQTTCKLSTINLCKGMIMEDFVKSQSNLGTNYKRLIYVGDGKNDYCPILRLNSKDLACVRQGFTCEELIKENGKDKVKAEVCIWKTGHDILKHLVS